ncbi:MAG: hypothetical protein HS115_16555 [Spirochaetales bacterium]|nr:hypothetical protein [Spirochaetales bacterium]
MKLIFSIFPLFLLTGAPLLAQMDYGREAERLMQLSEQEQKARLEKMSASDADSILSHLRQRYRAEFPEVDRLVLVIAHLETVKATSLADMRLRHLLAVFIAIQALFIALFTYIVIQQRRWLGRPEAALPQKEKLFSG